jgi:hypothetical protein
MVFTREGNVSLRDVTATGDVIREAFHMYFSVLFD